MYRTFSLCVLFALGGGDALGDVDHTLSMSVVQVHAYPHDGKVSLGSGVVVGPGRVATNCHITRGADEVVVSKGPERHPVEVQRVDIVRDLCLLDAPTLRSAELPIPVAKLGRAARLSVGEPLYLYGFPRGIGIAFSQGQVRSLHTFQRGQIIETSTDFSEGASGGGIFNDRGELIGLATFFSKGYDRHYYAIPSDWIGSLAKVAPRKVEPIDGLPFWQNLSTLPPFLRRPGN